ncbi:heparinase II/III domain-containing protein [Paenibacillus sp. SAF-068]|uniref:heparinase II/III domain-containing protein n=1 Tax=Paenibacillus sp. SAF-068 TaxID=3436864 RepID=UPI003F7DF172
MEDSIHEIEHEHINQCGNESKAASSLSADKLLEKLLRPELATLYTDLKAYGERALLEPLPSLSFRLYSQFSDTGERKAYEQAYFDRRGRLAAVAMLALDTARPDALQALEEMLWDVCGEYTWCLPAHLGTGEVIQVKGNIDLFAAETVHMLAEIVTIHAERLDPLVIERIRFEAEQRIFTPLYRDQQKFHWQTADHNWSAVCGGCCGMAALLLLQDESTLRESISHTVNCMNAFLSGYGEDGGCAEGIGYWVYGFGYFTYYAEMLREYSEGELDLLTGSKIAAIAAFPLRVHLSGGTFVNYSDSAEQEEIPSGLLSLLASRVGLQVDLPLHIPMLTDDPCHRWAHLVRNVMWSDPAVYGDKGAFAQAERGFIFQNLGWMMAKGALDSPNTKRTNDAPLHVAMSVKGGHNDEPHNHNDLGQFIIHCGGENILCDPGAGLYTQAYFAPGREQLFHISSSGHNVPLIEGQEQSSGRQAQAHVLEAKLAEGGGELDTTLDLTSAYPGAASLARYTRQFHWEMSSDGSRDRAELRLIDRFQWKSRMVSSGERFSSEDESDAGYSSIVERWMSRVQPDVVKSGNLRWQGVHGTVRMAYDANHWRVFTEALDTVDHDNVPVTFYRTSLSWTGVIDEMDVRIEGPDPLETVCEVRFIIESKMGEIEVSQCE